MVFFLDLLTVAGVGGFVLFGLVLPLAAMWHAFFSHLSGFWDPEILAAVRMTVIQASVSAAVATLIGSALALKLPRGSRLVRAALGIPFGIPAIVAATAWVICLPKSLSYSLTAVIIAHVFFNVPWVALWVLNALGEVSRPQVEAARTLGASESQVLRFVVMPVIVPAAFSAFAQVFSLCAMSFILVMILGGGPPVETLETALYARIRTGGLDLAGAGACAVWQILITLAPWILFRCAPGRSRGGESAKAKQDGVRENFGKLVLGVGVSAIFLAPYLALFRGVKLSALAQGDLLRLELLPALRSSMALAIGTAFLSTLIAALGVWGERRSRIFAASGSLALVVPSGISVMVLGLGFFVAYGRFIDPFSASVWPIIFLQAMFFVPVAFRVFQPIARRMNRNAWDAALTLGASPFAAFRWVEWPRWRGPLLAVLALIAGAALGEVAAVSLFYNEGRIPVALLISRWMGQYRFEEAQALSLGLMLASAALIVGGMWVGFGTPEVRHE